MTRENIIISTLKRFAKNYELALDKTVKEKTDIEATEFVNGIQNLTQEDKERYCKTYEWLKQAKMKTEINPQLKVPERDYSKLPRLSFLERANCQQKEVGWESQRTEKLEVIAEIIPTLRIFADAWRSAENRIEKDEIDNRAEGYICKMIPLVDYKEVSLFYRTYKMLKACKSLTIN